MVTRLSLVTLTAVAVLFLSLQVHCQLNFVDRMINPADFQSVRNDVYDVSGSHEVRGGVTRGNRIQKSTSSSSSTNALPFPRRMALRVEGSSSEFNACGGFSGGARGTCCKACKKLNYKQGCWCRTWDCLCFNS